MLEHIVSWFERPETKRNLDRLAYIVFFAFAFSTWKALWRFAVDVPFWDEWSLVSGVGKAFSLDWILGGHNEHRVALTRFTVWVQYYFDGLNVRHTILFNFFLYFAFVFMLWRFCSKERFTRFLLPFFAWSTLPVENTSWGFQSCYFYYVMLYMASFLIGMPSETREASKLRWLALPLAIAAVFSFAGGVVACAGLVLLWTFFGYSYPKERIRFWISAALLLAGLLYWFTGYHSSSQHPQGVYFTSTAFWIYWFNVLSSAVGYTTSLSILPGVVIVIVFLWYLYDCWRKGVLFQPATIRTVWPGITAVVSLLVITTGRVGISIDQSKVSRYTTTGLMFLPVIFDALSTMNKDWIRNRRTSLIVAIGAALVLLAPMYDQFRLRRAYRDRFADREAGFECIKEYYAGHNGGLCENLYPVAFPEVLDEARTKRLSFTRNIK